LAVTPLPGQSALDVQPHPWLASCPEGPSGSVLLCWSEQATFVMAGVLGFSEVNQRLVVVLADHVRLVRPKR